MNIKSALENKWKHVNVFLNRIIFKLGNESRISRLENKMLNLVSIIILNPICKIDMSPIPL